jgi:RimJ/RimL family protein N-acetyltransferase
MTNELLDLDRNDWERVAADPEAFANEHQLAVGVQTDLLRGVAEQTLALFQRTGVTTQPWTGFLSVDRASNTIVGTCCFVAPPDDEGVVEIAYFTFPGFEGRGVASAMAAGLVDRARSTLGIRRLRAHTLPEKNASTRVLEKLGFRWLGDAIDRDEGRVWRWERDPMSDMFETPSE